jgi:hypothetical protein
MAPYLPRSTKLATSHAALMLTVKTPVNSHDQWHLQQQAGWLKGRLRQVAECT